MGERGLPRRVKLAQLKEECERRRHERVQEQHAWLCQVLNGHYRYYGVPTNYQALAQFRRRVRALWHWSLSRRSQRGRWRRAKRDAFDKRFALPEPRIQHPWPEKRSADPRWKPSAGNPLAGFCPGGGPKGPSLPEQPDLQKATGAVLGTAERIEEVIVIVDAAFGGRERGRAPSGRELGDAPLRVASS